MLETKYYYLNSWKISEDDVRNSHLSIIDLILFNLNVIEQLW